MFFQMVGCVLSNKKVTFERADDFFYKHKSPHMYYAQCMYTFKNKQNFSAFHFRFRELQLHKWLSESFVVMV